MPRAIASAQCRTQLPAYNAAHNAAEFSELFWHTLPHTIHNASHNFERTLPRTILNCRAGNGIILTLLQNLHNFSLSSVTPRAVNIYLQHVECVFEFKWLFITVTNSISHDPSSIGYTTQRLVLQQHQLRIAEFECSLDNPFDLDKCLRLTVAPITQWLACHETTWI